MLAAVASLAVLPAPGGEAREGDPDQTQEAMRFFGQHGVTFPEGASIRVDAERGVVEARNTPANLGRIGQILRSDTYHREIRQAEVSFAFFGVPRAIAAACGLAGSGRGPAPESGSSAATIREAVERSRERTPPVEAPPARAVPEVSAVLSTEDARTVVRGLRAMPGVWVLGTGTVQSACNHTSRLDNVREIAGPDGDESVAAGMALYCAVETVDRGDSLGVECWADWEIPLPGGAGVEPAACLVSASFEGTCFLTPGTTALIHCGPPALEGRQDGTALVAYENWWGDRTVFLAISPRFLGGNGPADPTPIRR